MTSGKKASLSEPHQQTTQHYAKPAGGGPETHVSDDDQLDARHYRPMHVSVQFNVCDVQAHLVKVK